MVTFIIAIIVIIIIVAPVISFFLDEREERERKKLGVILKKIDKSIDKYGDNGIILPREDIAYMFDYKIDRSQSINIESITDPIEFELALARYFEKQGYQVEMTPASNDYGVDLVLYSSTTRERIAIQAKFYRTGNSVTVKAVQEVHAGAEFYSCDKAAVITNSHFSSNARTMATKLDVTLIDGTILREGLFGFRSSKRNPHPEMLKRFGEDYMTCVIRRRRYSYHKDGTGFSVYHAMNQGKKITLVGRFRSPLLLQREYYIWAIKRNNPKYGEEFLVKAYQSVNPVDYLKPRLDILEE